VTEIAIAERVRAATEEEEKLNAKRAKKTKKQSKFQDKLP
jgi:hypothetical protein